MTILRESILEDIRTTLEQIESLQNVQRWEQSGNTLVDVPCVVISASSEDKQQTLYKLTECVLNVTLDLWIRHDPDLDTRSTDTILNELLGHIEVSLMQDVTRGGKALETRITGNVPFESVEGQPYAGLVIHVEVLYRHKTTDLSQNR